MVSRFSKRPSERGYETGGHDCQANPGGLHQPDPVPVHRRRIRRDRLLRLGVRRLQLSDPADAFQIAAPDPTAPATHSVAFYCEDVDAVAAKAEQAGATIREPAQTFVTGDRFASILDPFGQRWTVMTRVEDVSPEERDRRMAEWAKENVGS